MRRRNLRSIGNHGRRSSAICLCGVVGKKEAEDTKNRKNCEQTRTDSSL